MRQLIAAVILLFSAVLLFTRLGHYALWDDEAVTALAAKGILRTGDTSVVLDQNIVAYRSGLLLSGTKERSTPPLGAYLAAPFIGMFGGSPWAARFPFAFLGLASVGLILWWLYTISSDWLTWVLVGLGLIGNVSLWLFCRQCRYYSPAIFSSILIAFIYLNYNGKTWQLVLLAIAGLMLLGSNYLNYVALHICLLVDYLIIGRKRRLLTLKEWLIVLVPQIVIGGVIVLIWNTLGTGNAGYFTGNSLGQRFKLVWMNLIDLNNCEFGVGLFLLAAPILYFATRREWLIRAPLVLLGYVFIISLLSPQLLQPDTAVADVRYLAPIIPLCIAIGVMVLIESARLHRAVALGLAFVAATSNVLHASWLSKMPVHSSVFLYAGELANPPPEPYTPTSQWIKQYIAPGQTVWVTPDYMTYPLMYHAPHPIYAWQFRDQLPEAFKDRPPIHIYGQVLPEFVIAFGPGLQEVMQMLRPPAGIGYQNIAVVPVFWHDSYRPELLWHGFKPVVMTQEAIERGNAVYIFQLVQVATPTTEPKP